MQPSVSTWHVCTPISDEHRRGMKWFAALSHVVAQTTNLGHSVQFYSLYAQTGDNEYLERCEDFLRYVLSVPTL
jgi:hypothetical protein